MNSLTRSQDVRFLENLQSTMSASKTNSFE